MKNEDFLNGFEDAERGYSYKGKTALYQDGWNEGKKTLNKKLSDAQNVCGYGERGF